MLGKTISLWDVGELDVQALFHGELVVRSLVLGRKRSDRFFNFMLTLN
ncbi:MULTISPECIES: hypothetical protein [Aphanizomenon]|uniref:Uncharacterized protein n=1 Tax=Aphanizomenon flos-aquae FACHB-1249 TaxID=2692889 RepID=A0ABR8IQF6_APHFL|nr:MULTISPECIES: hypothetical protein [Aphanizomenon]MBD2641860.1 hypothetical protein [Aphanizomenon sp. FACHB-1401]MBD2684882.1 hypothetical protein [Aphanizomenon flos-aquae FACHB-1249]MBD2390050.1 hypothetical protein [Aphanizomenon flos-aquae FACHB-1171]MBD2555729.1 hypothetical protein [Aphanizomenon flos-aquae FACHB-1290]MBD2630544.1 hypothetical protein [Aphanizomenon sp. FACHB-1399]